MSRSRRARLRYARISYQRGGPSSRSSSTISASRTDLGDGVGYVRTGWTSMVTMLPPASGTSQRLQRQANGGSRSAVSSYGSSITHGSPRNDVTISSASYASAGSRSMEKEAGSSPTAMVGDG